LVVVAEVLEVLAKHSVQQATEVLVEVQVTHGLSPVLPMPVVVVVLLGALAVPVRKGVLVDQAAVVLEPLVLVVV
jgi:hypothetical protein